jgi:diguanylate cyclase (GGDEF)-like protein/PAS domain S-box-containing protein
MPWQSLCAGAATIEPQQHKTNSGSEPPYGPQGIRNRDGGCTGDDVKLHDSLYKVVFDGLDVGVAFLDVDRKITYWSKAAEKLTGFDAGEIVGSFSAENRLRFLDENNRPFGGENCSFFKSALEKGEESERRLLLVNKDGKRVPVLLRLIPVHSEAGAIVGAVKTFTDLTAQDLAIESIKELRDRALIDPLTRMANRRFTETTIRERLEEMNRYGKKFGLLFIDMDRFQDVNDRLGYHVGDLVLQMVTSTLNGNLRPFDFVGRWGGDEFVVLLVNVTCEQLPHIAERLRCIIKAATLSQITEFDGITVSIGGTLSRPSDSVSAILKRVDSLMYQSKRDGRNRVTIDDLPPEMEGMSVEGY